MCLHVLVRSRGFSCFEVACILGKSCQHRKLLWHSAAGIDLESLLKTSGCAETIWRAVLKAMLTIINRFSFHPILFRIHNFLCERERGWEMWELGGGSVPPFFHFSPFLVNLSFFSFLFATSSLQYSSCWWCGSTDLVYVCCAKKRKRGSRYDMFTMFSVFAYSSGNFSFLVSKSLFTWDNDYSFA